MTFVWKVKSYRVLLIIAIEYFQKQRLIWVKNLDHKMILLVSNVENLSWLYVQLEPVTFYFDAQIVFIDKLIDCNCLRLNDQWDSFLRYRMTQ